MSKRLGGMDQNLPRERKRAQARGEMSSPLALRDATAFAERLRMEVGIFPGRPETA